MWYYATSAGAPTIQIIAHCTIFECPNHNTAPTGPVPSGTNYKAITLLSTTTATLDAWTEVALPEAFDTYPWKWVRFTAEGGTADFTAFYLAVARKCRG